MKMSLMRNVFLYLIRKKSISLILLIIFTAVFAALQLGTALLNSAGKEADSIARTLGGSFNVEQIVDYNDESLWTDVEMTDGVVLQSYISPVNLTNALAEKIAAADGIAAYNAESGTSIHTNLKVKEAYALRLYEAILSGEEEEQYPGDMYFWEISSQEMYLFSSTDSSLHRFFRNGALEIIKGRHIQKQDKYKIVVSEYIAERNNLDIGDEVVFDISERTLEEIYPMIPNAKPAEYHFEIVGIFRLNFEYSPPSEYTTESALPENTAFVDNTAMNDIKVNWGAVSEICYKHITFFVEDPAKIDEVIANVEDMDDIAWHYIGITKDNTEYLAMAKPLEVIKNMGLLLVIGSAGGCFAVLFLLMTMRTKTRKREIGILMAVGISKKKIVLKFMLEALVIAVIAFIAAMIISGALMQPLGDSVNAMTQPAEDKPKYNVSEPTLLYAEIEAASAGAELDYSAESGLAASAGAGFAVILVPVLLSTVSILKMKPKDVLTD